MNLLSKPIAFSILSALLALTGNTARAGVSTSGGGMVVTCLGDSPGSAPRSQLLDLFEAEKKFGFQLKPALGSAKDQYIEAVHQTYRLQGSPNLPVDGANFDRFSAVIKWTATGEKLPFLNDQGTTAAIPANCRLEQVAIFDGESFELRSVRIDTEIWNRLDSLNQAALVMHELWYWYMKSSWFAETSEETRATVAHLFTLSPIPSVVEGVDQSVSCAASKSVQGGVLPTSFYLKIDRSGPVPTATLNFTHLAGRAMVTKATATLPGLGFELSPWHPYTGQTVADPSANQTVRVPLIGSQFQDWSVEIVYQYRKPIEIRLYRGSVYTDSDFVTSCN
jgi:hypothetical protein